MSDVDAVRWMASEHDLEFVDLDTYGVDPAAGEILPASLSRQLHVVAIKRKFGTPVIATADPDDVSAEDAVRASIGRDFISVVASRDQIGDYLDQLFGPEGEDGLPNSAELDELDGDQSLTVLEPEADEASGDPLGTDDSASNDGVTVDPVISANGKRRRRREESKQKSGKSTSNAATGIRDGSDRQDLPVEPEVVEIADSLSDTASGDRFGSDGESVEMIDKPLADLEQPQDRTAQRESEAMDSADTLDAIGDGSDHLEPATSLLPEFGANHDVPDWLTPSNSSAVSEDPLAELARSVEDEEQPSADSTALTADLVAEAVATYQEQHGDEQRFEAAVLDSPTGTAMFPPLAKALVEGDRVSLEDMEAVLEEHYRSGQSIARILTAQQLVTEADLMWGMAEEMGLDFVDLDTVGVDFAEAGTIPEATARHHNVIVIANDEGTPVVAASNPTDVFAMDDLRTIIGRNFIVVVATRSQISAFIGRAFNSGGDAADMAMEASRGFDGDGPEEGVADIQAVTEEAPIVRYVNLLILQALNERASDIHVEPTSSDLRIRYRIDGVLHDVSTAPRTISAAVTTRLKVMADMNVAEHRIPQDGRISLNVGSKGIDLRMATLPTIHGEKVVMRVLDKSSVVLGFPDLGFDEDLLSTYEGLYSKPYGTILVTGPTGSGKSTTLYTTLTALNSPEKNIITVEDPVELQLKGVNQIQLNVKAGLTFASALKSILRSDPDIVLVGEIRDKETAVIAIEAALTGHMVLATLHTNSAAATPMRLIEMGIEPFLVTSSLSGVLAQRLARRLCMHCKEAYEPTTADITAAGWSPEEVEAAGGMPKVFRAIGCSACANTGYRGRKALAELLPMTEEIERTIIEGGSVEDIHRIAVAQGMLTLRRSGLRKAIEGETTLEEVLRVVA
jgi:type IV pilus assembly protein PilB